MGDSGGRQCRLDKVLQSYSGGSPDAENENIVLVLSPNSLGSISWEFKKIIEPRLMPRDSP